MPLELSARRQLVSVLRGDLEALDRLSGLVERFGGELDPAALEIERVWATAMALHRRYTALEHSCERIARGSDRWVADQARWHQDLPNQMFIEMPGVRPAVFPVTLRTTLEALLAFRHFARDAYDVDLEPRQITLLVGAWRERQGEVLRAPETFIAFLEQPQPSPDR